MLERIIQAASTKERLWPVTLPLLPRHALRHHSAVSAASFSQAAQPRLHNKPSDASAALPAISPPHFLDAGPFSGAPCRHYTAPEAPANFATGSVFLGGGYYSRTPPNDLAASVVKIDPASYLVGAAIALLGHTVVAAGSLDGSRWQGLWTSEQAGRHCGSCRTPANARLRCSSCRLVRTLSQAHKKTGCCLNLDGTG